MSVSFLAYSSPWISTDIPLVLWGLGTLGILGLSVLGPLFALPIYHARELVRRPLLRAGRPWIPESIDILIPAHNEAATIAPTLTSVQRAIRHLEAAFPGICPDVHIHVGADACTDNTVETVKRFPDVLLSEFPTHKSKWKTLQTLCMDSQADWIFLVDAGAVWPDAFLSNAVRRIMHAPRLSAICPSYQPIRAGRLSRLVWQIEFLLKRLEGICGGPVSVHGATVGYKAGPLKRVLKHLDGRDWLNDDVVIPLTLRALFPDSVVLYPAGEIFDEGIRTEGREIQRRQRIATGNLQWASHLLPDCFRRNPVAGLLAIRRLFRILWAYWLALAAICLALMNPVIGIAIILLATGVLVAGNGRDLTQAAWVSFRAPFRWIQKEHTLQEAWK